MAIMEPEEVQPHLSTSLDLADLAVIVDANDAVITEFLRKHGISLEADVVEWHWPATYDSVVFLKQLPSGSVSIREMADTDYEVTLSDDDVYVYANTLRRRSGGTNDSDYWRGPLAITYHSADLLNAAKRALIKLCQLDVNIRPGLTSFTVGQRSESYSGSGAATAQAENRQAILDELVAGGAFSFA